MNLTEALKEDMRKKLEPLIIEARKKRLWIYSTYQQIWFSPDELKQEHDHGKYLWNLENWKLRDPIERVYELEAEAKRANNNLEAFYQVYKLWRSNQI